jgi:V/A-type H+-transporting ATPase subunit E
VTHPELIGALRKAAEERTAAIWDAARAEAERLRSEAGRETADLCGRGAEEDARAAESLLAAATVEAESEARRIMLAARAALGERAYRIARELLPRFRGANYASVFGALVDELPARTWARVRVGPADRELARSRFLDAEVVPDEGVVAGLVVESDDGRIRIDNTLETRLARAWPEIVPGIVDDAMEDTDH